MRGKRERIFECEYGSGTGESRTVVRAWTPIEAAQTLEEALVRAGSLGAGKITVRDHSGHVLLTVPVMCRPGVDTAGVGSSPTA